MRILVLWADEKSPNLGVRALARGSRDLLARVWPDAEFVFADFTSRPEQIPWGRPRSLWKERALGRLGMQDWLAGFDVVWDTRSGDSFTDIYGPRRHAIMASVHEFAVQAGASVMIAPQTIGPFSSARGRMLARRNLSRSALVFARDPRSAVESHRLGRSVDATSSDLAFAIEAPAPTVSRDVMMNVSGLLWKDNPHTDARVYRDAVRVVIRSLLDSGRGVTLFPHVLDSHDHDNDVPALSALTTEFSTDLDVFAPTGLDDVRSAVSSSKLVIGARMHACLNALSTGVPAIAMAYSRKFEPLLNSVDWPHSVSLVGDPDPAAAVLRAVADESLEVSARETMTRGRSLLDAITPIVGGAR
ncbi:MAG: polysaccharide pyruvyl transferase family protein [Mycetocola sp.]